MLSLLKKRVQECVTLELPFPGATQDTYMFASSGPNSKLHLTGAGTLAFCSTPIGEPRPVKWAMIRPSTLCARCTTNRLKRHLEVRVNLTKEAHVVNVLRREVPNSEDKSVAELFAHPLTGFELDTAWRVQKAIEGVRPRAGTSRNGRMALWRKVGVISAMFSGSEPDLSGTGQRVKQAQEALNHARHELDKNLTVLLRNYENSDLMVRAALAPSPDGFPKLSDRVHVVDWPWLRQVSEQVEGRYLKFGQVGIVPEGIGLPDMSFIYGTYDLTQLAELRNISAVYDTLVQPQAAPRAEERLEAWQVANLTVT